MTRASKPSVRYVARGVASKQSSAALTLNTLRSLLLLLQRLVCLQSKDYETDSPDPDVEYAETLKAFVGQFPSTTDITIYYERETSAPMLRRWRMVLDEVVILSNVSTKVSYVEVYTFDTLRVGAGSFAIATPG